MSEQTRRSVIFWVLAAAVMVFAVVVASLVGPWGAVAAVGPSIALGVSRGFELAHEEDE